MKKKLHIIVALLLVAAVLLPQQLTATPATQHALDEARRAAEAGRAAMAQQQNLLDGIRDEMDELMEEMRLLDMAHADAAFALENIQLTILATTLRIEEAEMELEAARYNLDDQYQILRYRLRAMHEIGPVGLLDVLFQAQSISDFFQRMEKVRAVAALDQQAFDNFEAAEAAVQSLVDELRITDIILNDMRWTQMNYMHNIERLQDERDLWFAQLQENEEMHQAWLFLIAEEQAVLDAMFGVAQAEHQMELDAQEQRRLQEAAQRAAQRRAADAAALAERMANINLGPWAWPVENHFRVTSPFGPRPNPFNHAVTQFHSGTDVGAPTGTRVFAMQEGYVRLSGWSGGYGLTVIIDHAGGYSTLYAHHSRNRVEVGQFVTRGQHIADVGSTGQSTGPHLHFEIIRNGVRIDPMTYFP
jgi:septal ring factor EnvC (AmiA/AmiB activator)